MAGGAAHEAGAAMRERVLAVAGLMLEIDPGDLEMTDSVARVKGDPDSKSVTLAEIAAAAYLLNPTALPPGAELGLEMSRRYKAPQCMFSNACHAVTVEVDRETGMVHILRYVISEDCGQMINPNVVEGQTAGGRGAGHRRGVLRAHPLRRRREPDHHHVHGLPAAHRGRGAGPGIRPRRHPGPHPGRAQGPRRRRRHRLPGRADERGPRRAGPARGLASTTSRCPPTASWTSSSNPGHAALSDPRAEPGQLPAGGGALARR